MIRKAPLQDEGSLAQLVQSVCLTSRGSGVRIPQLPQNNCKILKASDSSEAFLFWFLNACLPAFACKMFCLCSTKECRYGNIRQQRSASRPEERGRDGKIGCGFQAGSEFSGYHRHSVDCCRSSDCPSDVYDVSALRVRGGQSRFLLERNPAEPILAGFLDKENGFWVALTSNIF